ncbi:MAG: hypothetical protein WBC85_09395 [Planktotalea sp.]|uniref:hypothetical protein n=1 Tax=Planktotalea sp. TaxID=2029877 RepID=UPI003C75DDE1
MTWTELISNWNKHLRALARRFPHADAGALGASKDGPSAMSRVLAKSHDLTVGEAREALDDFLFVQGLARDTADIRRHDVA